MKTLLLTLAVFAVAQAAVLEPRRRPLPVPMSWIPVEVDDRIVGGNAAGAGNYQYQISLQRKSGKTWYHSCGGSKISSKWVITAAHCVDGARTRTVRVAHGIYRLSDTLTSNPVGVSRIIVHENYDTFTLANDIALMELKADIGSNNAIAISYTSVKDNDPVIVTGWGALSEGGSSPDELYEVTVPVIGDSECAAMFSNPSDLHTDEMFCAGLKEGGKDSCQGDSGGPVALNGKLVGLVSWGYGCARANSPGVYTRLSHYEDWINTNMA